MSEELSETSAAQLHLLNKLYFTSRNGTPSEKLDSLRGIMHQLQYSRATETVSSEGVDILMAKYYKQYVEIMDSRDGQLGANNYSEQILAQTQLHKTECERWESRLPLTNLKQLPCLAKFLDSEDCKIKNEDDVNDFMKTLQRNWKTGFKQTFPIPLLKYNEASSKALKNIEDRPKLPSISSDSVKNDSSSPLNCQDFSVLATSSRSSPWHYPVGDQISTSVKFPDRSWVTVAGEPNKVVTLKRKQIDSDVDREDMQCQESISFRTAKEVLVLDNMKISGKTQAMVSANSYGSSRKSLGARKSGVFRKFVPPILSKTSEDDGRNSAMEDTVTDEKLKNIDEKMAEMIRNEIMDHGPPVKWDDIAGLEFVKKTVKEIIVLPLLRPDIFTGLRGPPKGLLLFGPPGTGKTLIGKCIASNSKSTFFCISASSLTSKWVGEGEKMVRTLFAVARCHQPSVIFIDEIDSLLTQRNDSEHESSRRMKTEFLVQLDGAATNQNDKILVVGATNRPQELDEAARRRLSKRLYVPLPDLKARIQIISSLLNLQKHDLTLEQMNDIGAKTDGYSGADMANLCKEAALGPIRSLTFEDIEVISVDLVRPITHHDFIDALHQVKASVSQKDLKSYAEWNEQFGSTIFK